MVSPGGHVLDVEDDLAAGDVVALDLAGRSATSSSSVAVTGAKPVGTATSSTTMPALHRAPGRVEGDCTLTSMPTVSFTATLPVS